MFLTQRLPAADKNRMGESVLIFMENSADLDMDVLEVTGALHNRVEQVLTCLRERGAEVTGRHRPPCGWERILG